MPTVPASRGFTLLELIVVLTLISIIMAVTTPGLAGRDQEAALRGVGLDLQALASVARARAVMAEHPVGLLLDRAGTALRVVDTRTEQGKPNMTDLIPARALPEGFVVHFKAANRPARGQAYEVLVFRPDGSVSGGDVQVLNATGLSLRYQVLEPLGALRLASKP
jgi:general secretion pathway protein H